MKRLARSNIKRLVLRAPNWLGDAVMAVPAIRAASEIYQPERLTVIAKGSLDNFYQRYSFIDEVIPFTNGTEVEAHKSLADKKFDAFLLLTNSFRSAWNARKAKTGVVAGYSGNFRTLLLSHYLSPDNSLHMTDFYLALMEISSTQKVSDEIDFPLLQAEVKFAMELGDLSNAVGIPLGAKYGTAKCWPEERLTRFIELIVRERRDGVVLFGTDSEKKLAERLASIDTKVIDLAGKTTIGEMAAVMDRCRWVVANDSGPLHVAAATGSNVLALFGSTDETRTAPRSENVKIIRKDIDCAPCYKRECTTDFRCMLDITAEEILREIGR